MTSGLLDLLSPQESRGVLAHEIAHIKNRDILIATLAAALAAIVTAVAHLRQFSALLGSGHDGDDERASWAGGLMVSTHPPMRERVLRLRAMTVSNTFAA